MRRIFQSLCQIMADILGTTPDQLAPDTVIAVKHFQDLAAAAIACEKTFHIRMEDEAILDLRTMEDWVDYIRSRIADEKEASPVTADQDRESWYYQ